MLNLWIFRFVLTHSAQNNRVIVILSAAKYPQNLKCEFAFLKRVLNSLDFSLSAKAQNDNAEFLLCANAMRSN